MKGILKCTKFSIPTISLHLDYHHTWIIPGTQSITKILNTTPTVIDTIFCCLGIITASAANCSFPVDIKHFWVITSWSSKVV